MSEDLKNNTSLRNSHEVYLAEKSSRPGNMAFKLSVLRKAIDLAILIISGILYSTIFPPLNFDFYAWFSLVPLFFLVRGRSYLEAFTRGLIWGYVSGLSSFIWLREIEVFVPFLVAIFLSFFPAVWCVAIPFIERYIFYPEDVICGGFEKMRVYREANQHGINWNIKDIHFALILASLWTFIEWVRSWLLSGLPWNLTAVSQWRNPAIIQICDITGVYGVSFVIVLLNIAICVTAAKSKTMIYHGRFRRPAALYFSFV
ncbi:MAG TPA: hypothetical protein PK821_07600, partial [Victivallales bacterium]|nr:hypothetical protein [Victivallales bacterium]